MFFSCAFYKESHIVSEKSILRDFDLQFVKISNRISSNVCDTLLAKGLKNNLDQGLNERVVWC